MRAATARSLAVLPLSDSGQVDTAMTLAMYGAIARILVEVAI